jgi:filamentous hemagglutinin
VAIPSGSLSHATILSVFVDKEPPAAGATDRTTSEHQPEGEQPAEGPQKKRSNTTRTGVERTNRQDWRKLVKSWDEAGYGDALSAENRRRIKDGTTPIVDDAWIEYFPGDVSLRGEKISMHHIGGSKLTVPHPKTRHKDAHTPGGFRKNPGGPGMTGSLGPAGREDSSDERHLA